MLTPENLLGSLIFSAIGLGAFIYGKKAAKLKALVIGLLLMIYPYFVTDTWLLYAIGVLLTITLMMWRE